MKWGVKNCFIAKMSWETNDNTINPSRTAICFYLANFANIASWLRLKQLDELKIELSWDNYGDMVAMTFKSTAECSSWFESKYVPQPRSNVNLTIIVACFFSQICFFLQSRAIIYMEKIFSVVKISGTKMCRLWIISIDPSIGEIPGRILFK